MDLRDLGRRLLHLLARRAARLQCHLRQGAGVFVLFCLFAWFANQTNSGLPRVARLRVSLRGAVSRAWATVFVSAVAWMLTGIPKYVLVFNRGGRLSCLNGPYLAA